MLNGAPCHFICALEAVLVTTCLFNSNSLFKYVSRVQMTFMSTFTGWFTRPISVRNVKDSKGIFWLVKSTNLPILPAKLLSVLLTALAAVVVFSLVSWPVGKMTFCCCREEFFQRILACLWAHFFKSCHSINIYLLRYLLVKLVNRLHIS